MNFCSSCGAQLQPGAAFCASCGAATGATDAAPQPQQATARQGLAQASLEVQAFNLRLLAGRIIGFIVAMVILAAWVGPAFGPEGAIGTIVAFFVLGFAGLFAGQWVALLLMRR
jgi:uncharacterized membrane protein YvbJ